MFACYAALLFIKAARLALAPPERSLCFTADVFFFSFLSKRDLRAPSADRPETLPCDRKLVQYYILCPKIQNSGGNQKTCTIRADFGQLEVSIATISAIGKLFDRQRSLPRSFMPLTTSVLFIPLSSVRSKTRAVRSKLFSDNKKKKRNHSVLRFVPLKITIRLASNLAQINGS